MDRAAKVRKLLSDMSLQVLGFIMESESRFNDPERWVPATNIKKEMGLLLCSYPKSGPTQADTGWLFGIIARKLEDNGLLEYDSKNPNKRHQSFCRSTNLALTWGNRELA